MTCRVSAKQTFLVRMTDTARSASRSASRIAGAASSAAGQIRPSASAAVAHRLAVHNGRTLALMPSAWFRRRRPVAAAAGLWRNRADAARIGGSQHRHDGVSVATGGAGSSPRQLTIS